MGYTPVQNKKFKRKKKQLLYGDQLFYVSFSSNYPKFFWNVIVYFEGKTF